MRFWMTEDTDRPRRRATSASGTLPSRAMPSAVQWWPAGFGMPSSSRFCRAALAVRPVRLATSPSGSVASRAMSSGVQRGRW
jgi:hypothetical protein